MQKYDTSPLDKTFFFSKITPHLQCFFINIVKLETFSLTNDAKFTTFVKK